MNNSFILTAKQPTIAHRFIAELRDEKIQQDAWRFRQNLRRLGQVLAYEISKTLDYEAKSVTTSLGTARAYLPQTEVVLGTILRAGLPFHQGFLDYFDRAGAAFIGAARREESGADISVDLGYVATPPLEGKVLLFIDPMLATGSSLLEAYQALLAKGGKPATLHVAAAVAARSGLKKLQESLPDAHFWLGTLDEELNDQAYIVPGLGDAGDLSFGDKMS